jgi:hypothetical protein
VTEHPWSGRASAALGRRILGWASRLVPFARRGAWLREWEAELWVLDAAGAPARRLVAFALGGVAHARSERREEEGMMMDGLIHDLRLAARRLVRTPGLTIVIVTLLGLGIGANTALFSALEAALLATPPYPAVERIALVALLLEPRAGAAPETLTWSYPKFELARRELSSFEQLAG